MSVEHSLLAAQGYLELEMDDEALRELEAVKKEEPDREELVQMRLFIFMRQRRWEEAIDGCQHLRQIRPEETSGYIHGAYCLHEVGRTSEARELLLHGPEALREEPTYHYNLGCYEVVLGNVNDATRHLETSFRMDEKFREIAREDPDLKPVRALWES